VVSHLTRRSFGTRFRHPYCPTGSVTTSNDLVPASHFGTRIHGFFKTDLPRGRTDA
jgi:hypothetical protein